jgi:type VI secretion system secreted protein VgrG
LVISDKNASFRPLPDQQLIYTPPGNWRPGNITQWEHDYDFRPGRLSQKDFDFQRTSSDLTTMEKTVLKLCNAQTFEGFDYPDRYTEQDLGSKRTRRLMEGQEAAQLRCRVWETAPASMPAFSSCWRSTPARTASR